MVAEGGYAMFSNSESTTRYCNAS